MNINTPEGMQAAQDWLNDLMATSASKFTWGIPRAYSIYEIDQIAKTVVRIHGEGDTATERVFEAMGFDVTVRTLQ